MKLIPMTDEHVAAIAALEKVCFPDPWSEAAVASEVNNPLSLWLVAMEGDHLAGYIGSQSVLGESDVMNVAVDPAFRRQGVARELIQTLIRELAQRGNHCLSLEVRASNAPAITLYEALGFHQVGRRPNYYRTPKEDALILRKEWTL